MMHVKLWEGGKHKIQPTFCLMAEARRIFAGTLPQRWSCCSFLIVSALERTFMEPQFITKWEVMGFFSCLRRIHKLYVEVFLDFPVGSFVVEGKGQKHKSWDKNK